MANVESMKDFSQQMVDQVFSYGELGFQEFETSRYLIDVLKKNGFDSTRYKTYLEQLGIKYPTVREIR